MTTVIHSLDRPRWRLWLNLLPGLGLTLLIALAATLLNNAGWGPSLGFSTLTLAIVLGIVLGNTVYPRLVPSCGRGVGLSKGTLLRAGIVLYGLRLTWQQLLAVGGDGLVSAALMLISTFMLAYGLSRLLHMDRQTALLIGAGSSICGAAAILATEPILKAKTEKVTVAVATVVMFGTLAIFLYPQMDHWHLWPFAEQQYGIYICSTVHEVAQVVAVGKAIDPAVTDAAVTVKMLRVMLLAPFLIGLSAWWSRHGEPQKTGERSRITVPWFAFGFVAVALFNSWHLLPADLSEGLMKLDTLLLTMAMAALGLTTNLITVRQAGLKPLLLGGLLMLWLVCGGGLLQMGLMHLQPS